MDSSNKNIEKERDDVTIDSLEEVEDSDVDCKTNYSELILQNMKQIRSRIANMETQMQKLDERVMELQVKQEKEMAETQEPPKLTTLEKIQQAIDQKRPVEIPLLIQLLKEHGVNAYSSKHSDANRKGINEAELRAREIIKMYKL
ncbi:uncharacterized protein LOC119683690 [Teleopsis dalmanni]|uniref:uncharacterized protein LOC119683635 n=1 Tax=Teleopsis dalmanni TaxID=139649 RepID=UPI0018CCD5DF|nr:uncharacterized protein LOC119683635 [Teleopsis dalmanni]XP_037953422.1 uncharacterized protein LOC119683690 [Teleopsis dalmanni]